ncbi:PepSY-associated TM helix domain-containing protein [Parapedobacter koreensis]|uniref:Uncharacterized iron-regulated membrane protein n=1 Tax=Parapedobacter koreensis TaxID=332977 RepID=A0A1H7S2K0_9SPHI|nr:PepSY-associated TM helix domain-containing protein [Parapedobacter koreensis]SEL66723.1 Uncharacterized iron-regulated membrane protein [Parapedobacter koreensis]
MRIRRSAMAIVSWLHRWLGIVSGMAVLIICITGCILVFEQEINQLLYPWLRVEQQAANDQLPPSEIKARVEQQLPGTEVHSLWYYGLDKSVKISTENNAVVYASPYTAEVLSTVEHEDLFHWIEQGHLYLWFPPAAGRQVVGWSTFVFFVLLITGLVLWYPKRWTKKTVESSFTIRWKARLKRLNYDLHNVLGFYALIIALVMTITGLVMSFPWMRQTVFWMAGGTRVAPPAEVAIPPVAHMATQLDMAQAVDAVWLKVRKEIARHNREAVIVHFPHDEQEPIYACTDMYGGSWRDLLFDQTTLQLLPDSQRPIGEEHISRWLMRANYGLHVGEIGGLTTKVIYFLASLVCASLPITGFYIWWGKRKKRKRKPGKMAIKQSFRTYLKT